VEKIVKENRCAEGENYRMNFSWFEHFKNDFVECSKQLNLNKAEISLFNMNVEAKRILEEVKKLLEPAIDIMKVLK